MQLHRDPSPQPPPSFDSLDASPQPPRALLVSKSWSADLRRAGLETIKRLSRPRGAARHRHSRSVDPPRLGQLERIQGASAPKVELHILILTSKSTTTEEDEEEAEARSILMRLFREAGASVQVHRSLHASHRLSSAITTSSVRASMRRSMEEGTGLHKVLQGGLDAAGFVFGEEEAEGNDASKAFLEELAVVFKADSTTGGKRTTPSITLYLHERPTEGEFDFDLPEVKAEKIAREAADVFTSSLNSTATSSNLTLPSTSRKERPRSVLGPSSTSTPSGADLGHNRRHSYAPIPPQSMLDSTSSSFRPLLLRPAPSAGPSAVSLRLAIHDSQDVVLRVTEASTPRSPARTIPAFRSMAGTPTAEEEAGAPPSPTRDTARESMTIPLASRGGGRSRSPNARANRISQQSLPRLLIPTIPQSPPPAPKLVSSFSPDSASESSSTSPQTPPIESATTPFNRTLFSPLCKLPPSAKPDGEGEGDTPASASMDSPRWVEVRGLLQSRLGLGKRVGTVAEEERQDSGVLFEAPQETVAWWSRR